MTSKHEARRLLIYADPAIFSGAERFLVDIVRDLVRNPEFEIEAAVPFNNERLCAEIGDAIGRPPAYDVPAQPLSLAALHLPLMARQIRGVLEGCDPDVVLVNLASSEYGAGLTFSGALPAIPKVGLLHVAVSMRDMDFRAGRLRDRLARTALRDLDIACVLSSQAERFFIERLSSNDVGTRLIRMPRPVVETVAKPKAIEMLGLPGEVKVIGMAGRITFKQKGQDTFVRAAALLAEEDPDINFAVAGEGQDEQSLIRMIERESLGERFHLLGQVEDIGVFLSALDAIAIPSRFEGLPLIALEALQAGVPGVASGVDGLLDVWPGEWQISPSDHVALASKLAGVVGSDRESMERLITDGRALAMARETDHPGEDVVSALREAMSRNK